MSPGLLAQLLPPPFANEGQDLYNRQRLDVKVDRQGQTADFLDLPINSMTKDEEILDDRNSPYSRLRAIRLQRLRG